MTTCYWGGQGTGPQNGGSGTWDSTLRNWSTTSGGRKYDSWLPNRNAVFDRTPGTVTLKGFLHVNQLSFLTNGYTIVGDGYLGLTGTATIDTAAGVTATIDATLTGRTGMDKTGAGTVVVKTIAQFGSLRINAGTLRMNKANGLLVNGPVSVAESATLDVAGLNAWIHRLSGRGQVQLGSGRLRLGDDGSSSTFEGKFSGTGAIVKAGNGTLTVTGPNTLAGTLKVLGGTLKIGAAAAASIAQLDLASGATLDLGGFSASVGALSGSGTVAFDRRELTVGSGDRSSTFHGTFSGEGSLRKTGTGTVTLTSNAGLIFARVEDGVLVMPVDVAHGSGGRRSGVDLSGGSLSWSGSGTTDIIIELSFAGGRLTHTGGITLTTGIAGFGRLTKDGAGTLTLRSPSTYDGPTTIAGGMLKQAVANALPPSTGLSMAPGAIFHLNSLAATIASLNGDGQIHLGGAGGVLTVGNSDESTFSGRIDGSGGIVKTGTGTLALGGSNSWSGTTTIQGGRLVLGPATTLPIDKTIFIAADTILDTDRSVVDPALLAGTGTVIIGEKPLIFDSGAGDWIFGLHLRGSGGLIKNGSHKLTFPKANSYRGTTTLNAGTLSFADHGLGSGPIVLNGGTLQWGDGNSQDISAQLAPFTAGATFDTQINQVTLASNLSGTGGVTKRGGGSLALTGANTFTGGITLAEGRLLFKRATTLASFGPGAIVVAAGGAFMWEAGATVDVSSRLGVLPDRTELIVHSDVTLANPLAGAGSVRIGGSKTLTLSGANTFAGVTELNGALRLASDASLATPNRLNIRGALMLDHAAATIGSIGGTGPSGPSSSIRLDNGSTLTIGSDNQGSMANVVIEGVSNPKTGYGLDGRLVKTGTGTLVLMPPIYSVATTEINGGTLYFTAAGPNSGTGLIRGNSFSIAAGAKLTLEPDSSGETRFTPALSGAGSLDLEGWYRFEGNNTLSGATIMRGSGRFTVGSDASLSPTSAIEMDPATVLDVAGRTAMAGSLAGAGSVTLGGGALTVGGDGRSTLFSGTISGAGRLTKAGSGTFTLTGANTFAGGMTVAAGTLLTNNTTGSAVGPGPLTVATGATLGGTGFIGAPTTVQPGGRLVPGNPSGTLVFTNGLTLLAGSTLDIQLDTTRSSVAVTGGTLTGPESGVITVNLAKSGPLATGTTFTLLNFAGAQVANIALGKFVLGTLIPGTSTNDYTWNPPTSALELKYNGPTIP